MPKYIYSHADGDYVSLSDVTTPEQEAFDRAARESQRAQQAIARAIREADAPALAECNCCSGMVCANTDDIPF